MAVVDRQIQVYVDWDAKQRERIKALITDELIAEHAAKPLGQHSDALERVLQYFRRQPQAGQVHHRRDEALGRVQDRRPLRGPRPAPRRSSTTRRSRREDEAMHGIFVRRVRELREA